MKSQVNPLVFTKLDLVLQRLCDSVQAGYSHVISGEVSPEKAGKLAAKFDINYQICADKNLRARRKRNGLGNARWITYLKDDTVYWWLLVTPPDTGAHAAHSFEKLVEVTQPDTRLEVSQFELVKLAYGKLTKPPKPNYKARVKATRYTWRMTLESYQNARDYVIEQVRSQNQQALVRLIYELYSLPGFGEVRSQVGKLVSLYQSEIKRTGITNAPKPLETLRYVRRLADDGIRLSVLVQRYKEKLAEVAHG